MNRKFENLTSSPLSGEIVTFGMEFLPGEIPAGKTVASFIPTQVTPLATYADGSLKHAAMAVMSSLSAKETRQTDFVASVIPAPTTVPTVPIVLPGVLITLNTIDGHTMTAAPTGTAEVVARGPLYSEDQYLVPFVDESGHADPFLKAIFGIRCFKGRPSRVEVGVENTSVITPGCETKQYDVRITMAGKVVFAQAGVVHVWKARWHLYFGYKAPVHVIHDPAHLRVGLFMPNYNPKRAVPEEDVAKSYKQFLASKRGILLNGVSMGGDRASGARKEVAPVTGDAVPNLVSPDWRSAEIMRSVGDLAGSWPAHYRYEKTGRVLLPRDLPNFGDNSNDIGKPGKAPRENTHDLPRPNITDDFAHEPQFSYPNYLLSAERWDLEELKFWAFDDAFSTSTGGLGHGDGLLFGQAVRGVAWSLRTLSDLFFIGPNNDPETIEAGRTLAANFAWFNTKRTDNPYGIYTDSPNGIGTEGTNAAFMHSFLLWSASRCARRGVTGALPFATWLAKYSVGRVLNPDFDWRLSAAYHVQVAAKGSRTLYDWKTMSAETAKLEGKAFTSLGPHDLLIQGQNPEFFGYLQGALAEASGANIPDAHRAFDTQAARLADLQTRRKGLNGVPLEWDIVPG